MVGFGARLRILIVVKWGKLCVTHTEVVVVTHRTPDDEVGVEQLASIPALKSKMHIEPR